MKKRMLAMGLALIMGLACLTGCGQSPAADSNDPVPPSGGDLVSPSGGDLVSPSGGVLVVSVNPKIAVEYDESGLVTGVTARNDAALDIISSCEGLIGQQTRDAVTTLVSAIGAAGYFVNDIDGERRKITITIEDGSHLPHDTFLDEVVADVRDCVSTNQWAAPLSVENESDYGITDYVDTDYGPDNDGVTDYYDTDYGPNNDGVTDYVDTDYGPNNDGVTDYYDTDYGPNNDGVTDYADTDYGPNNDGVTDYVDTDYGPNNDGVTDYNDGNTNYGNTNYGGSDYGSNYG